MKIAVASGKGGTGKTLIATSLAKVISRSKSVIFLDADVEAPNAHFFLKPDFYENQIVTSFTPLVIDDRCDGCGKCVEFCAYSALALVNKKILFSRSFAIVVKDVGLFVLKQLLKKMNP